MTTASQPRIIANSAWQDIAAGNTALASVDVLLQNLDHETLQVICGNSPSGQAPVHLDLHDSITVNAAKIWVRGNGPFSATVL